MLNPENQRKINSIYACIHTYVFSASGLRYYFLSFLVIILFFNKIAELIPRPARACPDPPMYLRLRMGRPIGKSIPLPTSVMSYGKNKLRPEYWFSVPQNRYGMIFTIVLSLYLYLIFSFVPNIELMNCIDLLIHGCHTFMAN